MDGAVGCVSLCPHVVILPKLGCANPKRVKVPGGCCDQLECPEETLVVKKQMKKHRKDSSVFENHLAERNKLSPEWRGTSRSLSGEHTDSGHSKQSNQMTRAIILTPFVLNLVSRAAFRSHPVEHVLVAGLQCESQTTAWSPCSKSCGTGVSTRLTNSNSQCKLGKETRLCLIRPCSQMNGHQVLFAFTAI